MDAPAGSTGKEVSRELTFPDWSGVKDHTPMSFEQAYKYNQELIAMFPPQPDEEARRWARKSNVEFVL